MNLSELVSRQGEWQKQRGIGHEINGRWCAGRIGVEVDELRAEDDPIKAVIELIDVLIISFGGLYEAAGKAKIGLEELDALLLWKLRINDLKYPLAERRNYEDTESYIRAMRMRWEEDSSLGGID